MSPSVFVALMNQVLDPQAAQPIAFAQLSDTLYSLGNRPALVTFRLLLRLLHYKVFEILGEGNTTSLRLRFQLTFNFGLQLDLNHAAPDPEVYTFSNPS